MEDDEASISVGSYGLTVYIVLDAEGESDGNTVGVDVNETYFVKRFNSASFQISFVVLGLA